MLTWWYIKKKLLGFKRLNMISRLKWTFDRKYSPLFWYTTWIECVLLTGCGHTGIPTAVLFTKHQEDTIVNSDFITVHTLSFQNPRIQVFITIITKALHWTHIWSNFSVVCVTSVSSSHRFLHRFSYTLCNSAVHATSWSPQQRLVNSTSFEVWGLWFHLFKYYLWPFRLSTFS